MVKQKKKPKIFKASNIRFNQTSKIVKIYLQWECNHAVVCSISKKYKMAIKLTFALWRILKFCVPCIHFDSIIIIRGINIYININISYRMHLYSANCNLANFFFFEYLMNQHIFALVCCFVFCLFSFMHFDSTMETFFRLSKLICFVWL